MEWGVPLYGDHAVYRAAVPFLTIMIALEQRSCDRLGSQLHSIAPKFACVLATRFSDVQVRNGTALVSPQGAHVGGGHADMRVLYHYPPVHPETYSVGVREVAILVSHLRAIAVGRKFLRSEQASANRDKKLKGHFLVLEEDAELGLLLSSRYDWITTILAALPSKWTVLQGAVIAELPWLKHLHKRLSASRRPFVARQSLRGLSWPFSPPRVLWANCSWVKPYWSAAAYIVSYRGANELLQRYWPRAPRLVGSTVDTRTQLWPAADQLIFNLSTSFLSHPFVTQPAEGTHSEHARFKREARDFVFNTWLPEWGRLKETKTVLASIFVIGDVGTEDFESVSPRSRKLDGICFQGAAQARAQPQRLRCRRSGDLPAHILVRPLKLHRLSISTALASLRHWLVDVGIHVPADALVWRERSNFQARAAAGAAAEVLALRAAVDAAKSARMLSSRLNDHLATIDQHDLVNSDHKGLIATGLAMQSAYTDSDLPPFVLFVHRQTTPSLRQQDNRVSHVSGAVQLSSDLPDQIDVLLLSSNFRPRPGKTTTASLKQQSYREAWKAQCSNGKESIQLAGQYQNVSNVRKLLPSASCCASSSETNICQICLESSVTFLVRRSKLPLLYAEFVRTKALASWRDGCLQPGQSMISLADDFNVYIMA